MNAKTIISLLTLILLISAHTPAHAESLSNLPARKLIIGYSGGPSSVDYWKKLSESLFVNAQKLDVVVIDFTGMDFTLTTQQKSLQKAADLKIDGMIIGSVSDKISNSIAAFQEKSIPVIAVNSEIQNDWVSTTISTNEYEAAEIAARYILVQLNKQKISANKIIILCGDKTQTSALIRSSVPSRIFMESGYDTKIYYSKGWSSKYSVQAAIAEFSSNGEDIAAIFSCSANASIASVETAEAYGYRPILVGFDMVDKIMKDMIRAGRLDATIIQDPVQIGKLSIEKMIERIRSETPLAKQIDVPVRLITHKNVEDNL